MHWIQPVNPELALHTAHTARYLSFIVYIAEELVDNGSLQLHIVLLPCLRLAVRPQAVPPSSSIVHCRVLWRLYGLLSFTSSCDRHINRVQKHGDGRRHAAFAIWRESEEDAQGL